MKTAAQQRTFGKALEHHRAGRLPEAEKLYRQILAESPDHADVHNLLGALSGQRKQYDEAIRLIQRAIELDPSQTSYYNNLGLAYGEMGRMDLAIDACKRAIELKPDNAEAHHNMGGLLEGNGMFEPAIESYRKTISLRPDMAIAHRNLSTLILRTGDLAKGWKEYEWRLHPSMPVASIRFSQPYWRGQEMADKTVLIYSEPGLADAIQLVRYLPRVAKRRAKITLVAPTELARLFSSNLDRYARIAPMNDPGEFDAHCSLQSLPGIFKSRLDTIPAEVPYLRATTQMIDSWQRRFAGREKRPQIGLAWSTQPGVDSLRQVIPSKFLEPLISCPVDWHKLQKGRASEEGSPPAELRIFDYSQVLTDFAETAALIHHLDLVISVDAAVAHLAAAMGKPVWLLLPQVAEWRWLQNRVDSPWYPTVRLFRCPARDDWSPVMQSVVDRVKELAEGNRNVLLPMYSGKNQG